MTSLSITKKLSFAGGIIFGFIGLLATLFIGGQILGGQFDAPLASKIVVAIVINILVGGAGYVVIFKWIILRGATGLANYEAPRRMHYLLYAMVYLGTFLLIIVWALGQN
jgi:hypothetical protein